MNMHFEITQDDVINVLNSHKASSDNIEEIMEIIDDDTISDAAMNAQIDIDDEEETLNAQTEVAYDEIAKQLLEAGYITPEQIKKYGNISLLVKKPKLG